MVEASAAGARVAAVVAGVVRQAVRDAAVEGILLRAEDSPEARLVGEWCRDVVVTSGRDDVLPAHPANKTALLLGGQIPPEPLLPLGDLYASQVELLAGGWTAPPGVRALAERAGGIAVLDRILSGLVDEQDPRAAWATAPPAAVQSAILQALERGRFARRRVGIVPKLGGRTLGIDFFA